MAPPIGDGKPESGHTPLAPAGRWAFIAITPTSRARLTPAWQVAARFSRMTLTPCHRCGAPHDGPPATQCPACRQLTVAAIVALRDYLAATLVLGQRVTPATTGTASGRR